MADGTPGTRDTGSGLGYAPNAYYAYDGPYYGYNNLPPDQVIANVQTALQEQGFNPGDVDGLLGRRRARYCGLPARQRLGRNSSDRSANAGSLGMT